MSVVKAQSTIVRKNSAGSDFQRRRVNLIEGSNVTLTVSDDSTNNEVDVTIAASSGTTTLPYLRVGGTGNDYVVDGTDDHVQIQQAIDAIETAGGGVVHLEGDRIYDIGASLTIALHQGLVLEGSGWSTVLKAKNSLNDHLIEFDPATAGDNIWATLRDFKMDGNNTNQTGGSCIYAKGAVESLFENLWITNPYDNGIYFDEESSGVIGHNNRVVHCHFDGGSTSAGHGRGIYFKANDENMVIGCDFQGMGGSDTEPYAVKDESGLTAFIGNTFVSGKHCIKLQNATKTRIIGNTFDGGFHQVYASADECVIQGNNFFLTGDGGANNTYSAVYIDFGGGNQITGNVFEAHTTATRTRSFVRDAGDGDNVISGNRFYLGSSSLGTGMIENGGSAANHITGNSQYTTEYILNPLALKEGSAPSAITGYGMVYVKSADGKIYFKADDGTEYDLTATGGALTWNTITADTTATADNGYIVNAATRKTLSLPSSCSAGKVFRVAGKGAGGWKVLPAGGQTIYFGDQSSIAGIQSSQQYDAAELLCITADTHFEVTGSVGNIEILPETDYSLSFTQASSHKVVLSDRITSATDDWGITAWIKPTLPQSTGTIFYNGDDAGGYGLLAGNTSDGSGSKLVGLYGGVAWIDPTVTLTNGTWQHVAMVRRSGTVYFYVGGVETSSVSSNPNAPTSGKGSIGCEINGASQQRFFDGLIDDVRFYTTAPSGANIATLAAGGAFTTGLASQWKFNEGSGSTAYDTVGTIDGTITSATYSTDVHS